MENFIEDHLALTLKSLKQIVRHKFEGSLGPSLLVHGDLFLPDALIAVDVVQEAIDARIHSLQKLLLPNIFEIEAKMGPCGTWIIGFYLENLVQIGFYMWQIIYDFTTLDFSHTIQVLLWHISMKETVLSVVLSPISSIAIFILDFYLCLGSLQESNQVH